MSKEIDLGDRALLEAVEAALNSLRRHEAEINLLNVYPVPDGDTGSNMLHTVESVYDALFGLDPYDRKTALKLTIDSSLMGGRGNSGVILSQVIKGFCETLLTSDRVDTALLSKALLNASATAYKAIRKPTEGTILTVIKDMAAASKKAKSKDLIPFFDAVVSAGRSSVEKGPELLPLLKEAGVVDAGGWGLVVMASAVLSLIKGEKEDERLTGRAKPIGIDKETALTFTYCTELTLTGESIDLKNLEDRLNHLGDSMLVVGKEEVAHIHIHTDRPGDVLNIATDAGTIVEVKINNMADEIDEALAQRAPTEGDIGIVAVAAGNGIKKILTSLGASKVITGGQSMNVSVKEIVSTIEDLSHQKIIVLPGNKNIILAAENAAALTRKEVGVVPTRSAPESFSALMAFNPSASLQENLSGMANAKAQVKTGELTKAVRDAATPAGRVKKGEFLGLINQEAATVKKGFLAAAKEMIDLMIDEESESLTLIFGSDVKEKEKESLTKNLSKSHPSLDLESLNGEQPLYHLIVGVE